MSFLSPDFPSKISRFLFNFLSCAFFLLSSNLLSVSPPLAQRGKRLHPAAEEEKYLGFEGEKEGGKRGKLTRLLGRKTDLGIQRRKGNLGKTGYQKGKERKNHPATKEGNYF